MHAQASKSDLKKALAIVLRAVPRKPGEGEGGVLIESWENSISLETCGGDHSLVVHVPAKVIDYGTVYVSAREVLESVKGEAGKTVDIRSVDDYAVTTPSDEYQVVKVAGRAIWRIKTPPAFLPLPSQSLYEAILDAQGLRKALQRTLYAVSPDWDIRGPYRSVYFYFGGACASLRAGSDWRAAEASISIYDLQEGQSFDVWLPSQAAENLMRSLADARDRIVVRSDGDYVSFACGMFSLVARIPQGLDVMASPDPWERWGPERPAMSFTTARADLLSVAKEAAKTQRSDVVPIFVFAKDGVLKVRIPGDEARRLPCTHRTYFQTPEEIALNPQFFADALSAMEGDVVHVSYYAPNLVRLVSDETSAHYIATIKEPA